MFWWLSLLATIAALACAGEASSHWVLVRVPFKDFDVAPSIIRNRVMDRHCQVAGAAACANAHSDAPVLCSSAQWFDEEAEVDMPCVNMSGSESYIVSATDGAISVQLYTISKQAIAHKALTFHDDAFHPHERHDEHPQSLRPFVEFSLIVPAFFDKVAIKRGGSDEIIFESDAEDPPTHRRLFRTAETAEEIAANRNITVTRHQHLDPSRTRSVTFLASGYKASESNSFLGHVNTAMQILRSSTASRYNPSPWDRYFNLINIYSVFEPSAASGASRPQGPGYACPSYMSYCGPSTIDNNLECAFGTPTPSRLGCSYEKSKALASFAPASDIIVVLVNDVDYGGTGSDRFCCLSAGSSEFPFLLVHEIAHSVGILGDEYTYGFSDESGIELPNCGRTTVASDIPWKYWIDNGAVPSSPVAGCSFDNYYRPTSSSCLMSSGEPTNLCPVCKDAMASRLITVGPGLSFAEPRCPLTGFDVYLDSTESATLTLNHRFVLLNDDVSVTWTLPGGATVSGVPSITVDGSALTGRTTIISATIVDSTSMMSPTNRPSTATQNVTFRLIRKVAADTSLTTSTCVSSTGISYSYNGVCTNSDGCTRETVVSLYDAKVSSALTEDDADKAVKAAAIVFSVIGLVALVGAFGIIIYRKQTSPQSVYDFGTAAKSVWITSVVFACLVLVVVCAAIVYIVRYLPETVVFGEQLFIAALVFAILIYLVALGTFVSALTLSTLFNTVFSILLTLLAIAIFIICMVMVDLVVNRTEKDTIDTFAKRWKSEVDDDPSFMCTTQDYFECSGFYYSCSPIPSSYCPSNCDTYNRNPNACLPVLQEFIWDKLRPAAICGILLAFMMLVTAVLTMVLCILKRKAASSATGRRSHRKDPQAPVKPLTKRERAQLQNEFTKADRNQSGTLEGDEVLKFVTAVFPEDAVALDEAQELIAGGPKTFDEIVNAYFPYLKQQATDPKLLSQKEAEEATNVVDLHRRKLAKIDRFTAASGALSPEALEAIHIRARTSAKDRYNPHVPNDAEMSPVNSDLPEENDDSAYLLEEINKAAKAYGETVEADMLRGLTPQELEGLRSAWKNLHPTIAGHLSDPEIDRYYQWSHEAVLESREHFVRWKQILNVRGTGRILWPEFCFPYAQRALLKAANQALQQEGKAVAVPGMLLNRQTVLNDYGQQVSDLAFLPFEQEIPVERAIAANITLFGKL
eukprot:GILI01013769.1.p1 GENE.GILI01013769.1~~GILI01013769.1.p1  ORF type:complete len:1203 (-),score=254.04 GILI01013769.1:85-3693(-)